MSILLTGSAGFIGAVVCRHLLEAGETIVGVDNLNAAYDPRIKHWRLAQLSGYPGFRFYELDISDHASLKALFNEHGRGDARPFSVIINLGARAGVRQSIEDPWVYLETNTTGTLNLLELGKEYDVAKFVLASTSSVYGEDTQRPFREDSSTSLPLSPYASSKKAAETLAYTYHYLHGMDITVLRFFTVYGPAGRPDMVIFRFTKAIAEGEPIQVFGDGGERDFTFVDDVARGVIAAQRPSGYDIINLGGDRPIAIADVITMLEDELGRKAIVEHVPRHAADVQATWADISKAKRLLGWQPQVSLEEGIHLTAQWYRDNRDWARQISDDMPS